MTRILIQRGNGSSSNQSRSATPSSGSRSETQLNVVQQANASPRENMLLDENREVNSETHETSDACETRIMVNVDPSPDIADISAVPLTSCNQNFTENLSVTVESCVSGFDGTTTDSSEISVENPHPPPPPLPPKHIILRRCTNGSSNSVKIGSPKRSVARPGRTSPSGSLPSSPRSIGECEGYNSADEQNSSFLPFFDLERERQFEMDIRRSKGLEVRRMAEDGNCLFRAVADQVYGDSEAYDDVRQLCLDYMERERDHFSPFITEGFNSYCKRKRKDKVYGNNAEIQGISEMYNRPVHIYSYTTEPINIFHGNYGSDLPPVRLSYHHGNHYNSLVDPRSMAIGSGLGFSSLRGRKVDKDQVKAAIKAQQDQQIEFALLAEGQLNSDLELTEKEIERMVMENSRAEYLANTCYDANPPKGTAESSSSGATPSGSEAKEDLGLNKSVQMVLSMGFSYLQAIEAYSIFGDDVDSMVCYLLETSNNGRRKGKAAESFYF